MGAYLELWFLDILWSLEIGIWSFFHPVNPVLINASRASTNKLSASVLVAKNPPSPNVTKAGGGQPRTTGDVPRVNATVNRHAVAEPVNRGLPDVAALSLGKVETVSNCNRTQNLQRLLCVRESTAMVLVLSAFGARNCN